MTSMLKLFLIIIVVAIPSCAAGGLIFKMGYANFNGWAGIITSIIAIWYVCSLLDKKDKSAYDNFIAEIGINPDYVYRGTSSLIIIDLTNKKIFMGGFNDRDTLSFSDITSIETDWVRSVNNVIIYRLILNTSNFHEPRKIQSFGGSHKECEFVYAKFRTALNIA